jgi:hypothetical protein
MPKLSRIQTEAYGIKYGWADALLNDYQHDGKIALTDDEKAKIVPNDKLMTYLVLCCTGKALNIITSKTANGKLNNM